MDKSLWRKSGFCGLRREGGSPLFDRAVAAIRGSPPASSSTFGPLFLTAVPANQFHTAIKQLTILCQQNYLRFEYYNRDRLLVLQAMPGAIHDSVQCWIECEVRRMLKAGFTKSSHWFNFITLNYSMSMPIINLTYY